ncbi:MAG: glycoside hydrolase family 32 protein [Bacteroidota bacterium]
MRRINGRKLINMCAVAGMLLLMASCNAAQERQTADNTEPHRPRFHFTPDSMWMNDPNGMVFYDGEYHLFYQYYPDSTVWGPMHWGHAISRDLVHWEHMPVALYPDEHGWIFSGSAVVDHNNTSGLGEGNQPPLIAIFTYHLDAGVQAGRDDFQTQGIAYSNDKGRTWTKYEGNPVLLNPGIRDFRDPKVMWHEPTSKWIMTLAVKDRIYFYSSPNLTDWSFESQFGEGHGAHGGVWECPDLIKMQVQGEPGKEKWVLIVSLNPGGPNGGSAAQYFVGEFDGKEFVSDHTNTRWLDYGKDNYAGVTWSNVPENDGRHLFIGWMSNWQYANYVPTEKWRSAMTFPRELQLVNTSDSYRVTSVPVEEIELLRQQRIELESATVEGDSELSINQNPLVSELILDFEITQDSPTEMFGIEFYNSKGENIKVGYNVKEQQFFIDRTNAGKSDFSEHFNGVHTAPYSLKDHRIKMHLLVDVASVELFAQDGMVAMTDIFFPNEDFSKARLFSQGGSVELDSGLVYRLNSIQ